MRAWLPLLSIVVCSWSGAVATAQEAPPLGEFGVLRYALSPGPNNYFQVDGAVVRGALDGAAGVQFDYAHQPFTLYNASCDAAGANCEATGAATQIVRYTAAAHVWGSLALSHRVQIGLILPVVWTEGEAFANPNGPGNLLSGGSAASLADPRLHLKVGLFEDASSGFRLGAVAWGTAPVGQLIAGGRYVGEQDPTFGGHAVAEIARSGFRAAVQAGGVWRDGDRLFSTTSGSQFTYGAALGYDITPLVSVLGEVVGATAFSSRVDENPLEARLGARFRIEDVVLDLAGGAGLVAGLGVPMFRVLGGFAWAPVRADTDGDGIQDAVDGCVAEAEDVDGWNDDDGCPEADNDRDGRLDADDPCPDQAEDVDGEADDDGCPDLDNDGDGIQDGYDSCPTAPEDMDGDNDEDGCPDDDRDRDHLADGVDQCPDEAEDTDGFGDEDGCPEVDFDGDGVPDDTDECPDQAEDADGFEDENGCPEEGAPPVETPAPDARRRRGR